MIVDFNIVGLLFIGYFVHSTHGGGKHEKVHVKIHVPEIVKHHHHTKVVFIHKPHHKPEPKKPLVVHHHHHHKHDHGHKHKHGHNHGHKHQHGHKHGHKHKHNLYHHHHEKVPHHHYHHHKKQKYIANEHVVDHFPVNGYRASHKSRNERYQTHSFTPPIRPQNFFESQSNYKVRENGYDDFTTSNYNDPPVYPQLSNLVNPNVEYIGPNENTYDDSSENLSEDGNRDIPSDYASDEHYEHLREPLHEEGFFDYQEETNSRLLGPDGQVLVTKTLSIGDNNGRHVSHSTEVI
ncbi:uncharacterized histidine-rich protein DDB_G0274557-like [Harmonia axyridis]|uniref:uncharacterized histidine-rich protein DDB_G0274557-like n=1 Tax=Harmonia axyridis TaxID=115357 RepID=UPI001E2788B1|nr:uncharacterized histidine-rich protein DDB_G0274557-like [Harmonia axyridis]